jgi:hypothetical protein
MWNAKRKQMAMVVVLSGAGCLAILALTGSKEQPLASPGAAAEKKTSPPSKEADKRAAINLDEAAGLSGVKFSQLQAAIRPGREMSWMLVPWETSITVARYRAAVENKPLVVMFSRGAGASMALGYC